MESMLYRLGFKKDVQKESEARVRLQKELFAFNHCTFHGFPHKPSAIAYDEELQLLAIATKTGVLRVHGCTGVEFSNCHRRDASVRQIIFLPGQGRLITVCTDSSLHLWELNTNDSGEALFEEIKEYRMGAKQSDISTCCLTSDSKLMLVGTESGNIYQLDVVTFMMGENIIYQDIVIQNVPDDFKVNPGAVEVIRQHPTKPDHFLIGYNRGLAVLWNTSKNLAEQITNASQQLEDVAWNDDGQQFLTAHFDGSYVTWSTSDTSHSKEKSRTPYGPFPCKAITKIIWKSINGESVLVFSGGMPRSSHGDKQTVTVMEDSKSVVFDLTSRLVDFEVVKSHNSYSLLILAEEELLVIDLNAPNWPVHRLPFLNSLHASAITCAIHVPDVPTQFLSRLVELGDQQASVSTISDFPISGGVALTSGGTAVNHVYLTGHEDGSIRFWDASTPAFRLLYKLHTSLYFGDGTTPDDAEPESDDEWPPFRKVGSFDPYSDDPRLGIQKLYLCPQSELLVACGTAGQVIVLQLSTSGTSLTLKDASINLVSQRDGFVWKGHEPLSVRREEVEYSSGFLPLSLLQLHPPAACTSVTVQPDWSLLAVGTNHGLAVFDFKANCEVASKCTLNPNDMTGIVENAMSRGRSFKKSLRESFRRLRKRRSDRRRNRGSEGDTVTTSPSKESAFSPQSTPSKEVRTIERQIEARSHNDDGMGSMVRSLHFADTYLASPTTHCPSLWAGTNCGHILAFQLILGRDKRPTKCDLAKEIHLKHGAPVLSLAVLDKSAAPVSSEVSPGHCLLISSEEQFKIFSLPALKPQNKYKLTAHEGSKVRRSQLVAFHSKSDPKYVEHDLVVLTNQGESQIFSVPHLRRQMRAQTISKDNISGITSAVISGNGEGFYQNSPSEVAHFCLSACCNAIPKCHLVLGTRPRIEHDIFEDDANNEDHERYDSPTGHADLSGNMTLDSVKDHVASSVEGSGSSASKSAKMRKSGSPGTSKLSSEIVKTTTDINDGFETKVTEVLKEGDRQINGLDKEGAMKLEEMKKAITSFGDAFVDGSKSSVTTTTTQLVRERNSDNEHSTTKIVNKTGSEAVEFANDAKARMEALLAQAKEGTGGFTALQSSRTAVKRTVVSKMTGDGEISTQETISKIHETSDA